MATTRQDIIEATIRCTYRDGSVTCTYFEGVNPNVSSCMTGFEDYIAIYQDACDRCMQK